MGNKELTTNIDTSNGAANSPPSRSTDDSMQGIPMPDPLGTMHTSSYHGNNVQTLDADNASKVRKNEKNNSSD